MAFIGTISMGESPEQALIAGITQPKARVSIERWNLKEAGVKHLHEVQMIK